MSGMTATNADRVSLGSTTPWSATRGPRDRISFRSPGYARLLDLHVGNVLLMIATATIWRFWAVTRARRELWAHVRLDGAGLAYTGTGTEILIGYLKVVLLVLLPAALLIGLIQVALIQFAPTLGGIVGLAVPLGLLWLVAVGRYLSIRYRVARTTWRGIRGRLAGTARGYLWLVAWNYLLVILTAGFFKPWMDAGRIRFAVDGARAGSLEVTCRLSGGDLFWSWLAMVLLCPFTFGISAFWYRARLFRMAAERSRAGPLRFAFSADGDDHAGLWLGNMALLFGPAAVVAMAAVFYMFGAPLLGLWNIGPAPIAGLAPSVLGWGALVVTAWLVPYLLFVPIVWQRKADFYCRHLVVIGEIEPAAIRQAPADRATAGEGLAGDFDAP